MLLFAIFDFYSLISPNCFEQESSLWTRAQATLDVPNESFSVLALPDPSQKLEMTYPGADESPDELLSTDNSVVGIGTDNIKESPTNENESVAKIAVAAQVRQYTLRNVLI